MNLSRSFKGTHLRAAVMLLGAIAMLGSAPGPEPVDGSAAISELASRSAPLKSYTFGLKVSVRMQTFPWMNFTLNGRGEYERPARYVVRFQSVPWFGKGFEQLSMAALDPKNWPGQYNVESTRQTGDEIVVVMHDRIKSPLSEMRATLNASDGVRRLVWTYSYGGKIELHVNPQRISGIVLPAAEDAQITMPNVRATAHAEFTDYRVVVDEAAVTP